MNLRIFSNGFNPYFGLTLLLFIVGNTAWAQDQAPASHSTATRQGMTETNEAGLSLMNLASGTSVNPVSASTPMIMLHFGKWNTMFMGTGFLVETQQSGPRGGDKLYSSSWIMASAQHKVGEKGSFQTDVMVSLEPATVTDRRYPLLFQTGETAYGQPLADAQHPHNFLMSLGFHYSRQVAEDTFIDAYFAPVGDPALGPVAFPHRSSAAELPQATISHHWQDSTHIADEVLTLGVSHRKIKLEASGFYGKEPGENRWIVETGPINSWSGRFWYFPSKHWAAQVSAGRIASPEASSPGDQVRATASLHYSRSMQGGNWSSSLIWGRTHDTGTGRNLNSYLVESVAPIQRDNLITGRFELVDKDELFSAEPVIERKLEQSFGSTFRIGSYTLGYTRNLHLFRYLDTGFGVNFSLYSLPAPIKPYYGEHPAGGNIFIRFQLKPPA